MSDTPAPPRVTVVDHGGIGVNSVRVERNDANCLLAYADLHAKRARASVYRVEGDEVEIHVWPTAETLYANGPYGARLLMALEKAEQWEISAKVARYTLTIMAVRRSA